MKKLMIITLSICLALGASAQRGHIVGGWHGGGYHYGPSIGLGFYTPFYSPFYGYPYPYGYGYGYRPSKLSMQVTDITNDYRDKIWSVRHDSTLTHKQRRQKIHELRKLRDVTIQDLRRNYYKR